MLKITADSSANQKILRKLKNEGLISYDFIDLENAKLSKNPTTPAFAMFDVSTFDDGDVFAPTHAAELDRKLVTIIGRNNHEDRRHLLGHYSLGNDVFVSGDKDDILSHKEELAGIGINVMSSEELEEYVRGLQS